MVIISKNVIPFRHVQYDMYMMCGWDIYSKNNTFLVMEHFSNQKGILEVLSFWYNVLPSHGPADCCIAKFCLL